MLCIDIYILFIVFMCLSLVSLVDYLHIDIDIRYLPLMFPV